MKSELKSEFDSEDVSTIRQIIRAVDVSEVDPEHEDMITNDEFSYERRQILVDIIDSNHEDHMNIDEITFMRAFMLAIGAKPGIRIWRQNVGTVPVRDHSGRVVRVFDAGPPPGAADLTGIVDVDGRGVRLEIETKAQGGRLSQAQRNWRRMIEGLGGVYVVLVVDGSKSLDENVDVAVGTINAVIAGVKS